MYRALARGLGLEPSYRRADLWRDIKQRIVELAQSRQIVPVWIIDESPHLAAEFFRDLPSFLNFSQDARDLITVWLVGHPGLASMLERAQYAALHSRIQVRVHFTPVLERERFSQLIAHALNAAGCTHTLLSDSALEQLREASRGVPRQAGRILRNAMRLAVPKGLNHIPDDLLQRAIEEVR
nr:ATP-binding protein [Paraburkholderia sp. NMBU_R16]